MLANRDDLAETPCPTLAQDYGGPYRQILGSVEKSEPVHRKSKEQETTNKIVKEKEGSQ